VKTVNVRFDSILVVRIETRVEMPVERKKVLLHL
jgi:hypothetical protein